MPVACCHTLQALHPPDGDLTPRMQAAWPWAAASPVLQAAGTHGRATQLGGRPERHLLRALPRRPAPRSAAARYCAAWEGSFEDRSSTLPVIRVYISSTSSTVVSKCEVASYLRMHRHRLRPSRSPRPRIHGAGRQLAHLHAVCSKQGTGKAALWAILNAY